MPRRAATVARPRPLLTALVTLALAVSLGPTSSPAAGATAPRTVSLIALKDDQLSASGLGRLSTYRHIVFQHWHHDLVSRIRSEAPGTQAIAYIEIAAVKYRDSCPLLLPPSIYNRYDSSPLSYCWVKRNHPAWLLKDTQGREARFVDFPHLVALDIGVQGARDMMIRNGLKYLRDGRFHGAFLDDVMIRLAHRLGDGRAHDLAKYSDRQYAYAMRDFAGQFGTALRNAGLVAMANVGADPWTDWQADLAVSLASRLTIHREYFSRWGAYCKDRFSSRWSDPMSDGHPSLSTFMDYRRRIQAAGGATTGADYGNATVTSADVMTMRYGRAQFLLTWNGKAGSAYFFRTCGAGNPARNHWTREVGWPTNNMAVTPSGGYRRSFQRGVVVLNPKPATTIAIGLPPGTYVDTSGRAWTGRITLPPRGAGILLRK